MELERHDHLANLQHANRWLDRGLGYRGRALLRGRGVARSLGQHCRFCSALEFLRTGSERGHREMRGRVDRYPPLEMLN